MFNWDHSCFVCFLLKPCLWSMSLFPQSPWWPRHCPWLRKFGYHGGGGISLYVDDDESYDDDQEEEERVNEKSWHKQQTPNPAAQGAALVPPWKNFIIVINMMMMIIVIIFFQHCDHNLLSALLPSVANSLSSISSIADLVGKSQDVEQNWKSIFEQNW